MTNPPTKTRPETILCHYINATNNIQVARIANIEDWYFERVVFPGQHLLFDAPSEARLEIHADNSIHSTLLEQIPCNAIQVESIEDSTHRDHPVSEY